MRLCVCVCVRERERERARAFMCAGLIVVQLRGTAERAHIWHRGTSMVTGNLTTQPVLWWQVFECVWWGRTGRERESARRKCEKERVKSVCAKERQVKQRRARLPTQRVHTTPLRIAKTRGKQFLHQGCWWRGLCNYVYMCVCVWMPEKLNRRKAEKTVDYPSPVTPKHQQEGISVRPCRFLLPVGLSGYSREAVAKARLQKINNVNKYLHGFVCGSACAAAVCVCALSMHTVQSGSPPSSVFSKQLKVRLMCCYLQ